MGGARRQRIRVSQAAGRRRPDDVVQARDDLGRGQPQRALEDVQHVWLPGELQPADDADGQLGREPVAGPPRVPDRQQLDDNAAAPAGGRRHRVAGDGRQRPGRGRHRQPADDRHLRVRGHAALNGDRSPLPHPQPSSPSPSPVSKSPRKASVPLPVHRSTKRA